MLVSNNLGEVLNGDVKAADVVAGVVAARAARRNGGNGNNWHGGVASSRNGLGSVGAVSEDNTVATLVIAAVRSEHADIEGVILSCIADSSSDDLLLGSSTARRANLLTRIGLA